MPCKASLVAIVLSGVASAGQPPPVPTAPPLPVARADPVPVPDEGLIEFLGADDATDTAWWEYLKRAAARNHPAPPPPTQDAKP